MDSHQMMYYGGYPANQGQIHGPYFDYIHNTLDSSSNYVSKETTEQMATNTFPSSNSLPLIGVKSEDSPGFTVNFPSPPINEKEKPKSQNIVFSSPKSHCKQESLSDDVDTSLKMSEGLSKPDRKDPMKIVKTSRSSINTVQQPRLPQQTLSSSKTMHKAHSKSKPKKNQPETSTDSSTVNFQQTDPFAQWYQMMSHYYSQFYPGYQMAQPTQTQVLPQQSFPHVSTSKPLKTSTTRPFNSTMNYGPQKIQIPPTNQTGSVDLANYYYQYYAAAAQLWSGGHPHQLFGTVINEPPRFYNTPHIKAWMGCPGVIVQVLPSRPLDGEFARVEIINLFELANEALADATRRASDNSYNNTVRTRDSEFSQQQLSEQSTLFTVTESGMQTPSRLSSIPADGVGDEDAEEARVCAMAAACWNQADHQFYPGPLSRVGTLKADVLAFLREKLSEIQDRLPIDWESADLLLMFLETLVKNNGNLQTSDLVNLLLEGHKPTTDTFRSSSHGYNSNSYLGVQVPVQYIGTLSSYGHQVGEYVNESLASLPGSQVPSGRESPESHFEIDYGSSLSRHSKAASETGRASSVQNIIRRMGAINIKGGELRSAESEDRLLDRFRELLMHGLPMKALEHACRSKLWGHAFTLAHRMGPSIFTKVMDRFLSNDISISDPILTLYQLTAGEMPQSINTAAYGRGIDNGDWRPHLAMILAAQSPNSNLSFMALERLGDGLLSRKHVYAAHLCYLLMNTMQNIREDQKEYRLPAKIWLIGIPPQSSIDINSDGYEKDNISSNQILSPLFATSEAIQLTEVYEYSIQLANRKFRLRQLLPFRLVYSIRLLDAGLVEKAYHYLTALGNDILSELDEQCHFKDQNTDRFTVDPLMYSLISNCLRLAEPLQYHQEIESFDVQSSMNTNNQMEYSGFGFQSQFMHVQKKNTNWIERLNEVYDQMNRRMDHPHYKPGRYIFSVENPSENPSTDVLHTSDSIDPEYSVDHDNSSYYYHHQPPSQQQQHQITKESNYQRIGNYKPDIQPSVCSSLWSTNRADQGKVTMSNPSHRTTKRDESSYIPQGVHTFGSSNTPFSNKNEQHHQKQTTAPSIYSSEANRNDQLLESVHKMNSSFNLPPTHQQQLHNDRSSNQQSSLHRYSQQHQQVPSNQVSNITQRDSYDHSSMNSPNHLSHYPPPSSPLANSTHGINQSYTPSDNNDSRKPPSIHYSPSLSNERQFNSTATSQSSKLPVSNESSNQNFFTPVLQSDKYADSSPTNCSSFTYSDKQAFDYFANIQSIQSRSRTVSGDSENDMCNKASSIDAAHSDQLPSGGRGMQSSKNIVDVGFDRSHDSSFTNERHYQRQPQQQLQQHQQFIPNFPSQPLRDTPSMVDVVKNDYNSTADTTSTTATSAVNERCAQDNKSQESDSQQSKDGWLSGWFGRLKKNGAKNIHLPDDSKPSIVWDDRLKQWIDVNDPDGSELNNLPPPPPASSLVMSKNDDNTMINKSSSSNPPTVFSNFQVSLPPGSVSSRASNPRSRYVNIMAPSETLELGANKLSDPSFQPPLPHTVNGPRP
ncbi:Protein transport protein isoform 3 [Schistosoma japonicum]|uniref:Protein transport protein isoform 3 n=2 Tax=Schistosoma japonicum TaxID=6182 RepID=A0A4Z2CRU6_SCHJA|nr:Protein transport protein isoform 3 [Schistosoma japonicum]